LNAVSRKVVKSILEDLGFSNSGRGNATGSQFWKDSKGRTCKLLFRDKDIHLGVVYSLGDELESKGVISRKLFVNLLKKRSFNHGQN
jgi:hypothetical protein